MQIGEKILSIEEEIKLLKHKIKNKEYKLCKEKIEKIDKNIIKINDLLFDLIFDKIYDIKEYFFNCKLNI
jgi:hypothetical protein